MLAQPAAWTRVLQVLLTLHFWHVLGFGLTSVEPLAQRGKGFGTCRRCTVLFVVVACTPRQCVRPCRHAIMLPMCIGSCTGWTIRATLLIKTSVLCVVLCFALSSRGSYYCAANGAQANVAKAFDTIDIVLGSIVLILRSTT